MKKSFFLLFFALSASFLLSCKSDTNTTAQTQSTKTEVIEETVIPQETTTITDGSYIIDIAASTLNWSGSKPSGKKHMGTVQLKSGTFAAKNGQFTEGQAIIDMNSIINSDQTGQWKTKIENHLKSPDFFDVAKYATSTITIKEAKNNGFKSTLTIKGIEKTVFIPATILPQGNNLVVTIKPFKIDRTEWGVKFNSGKFFQNLKDRMISDDMVFSGKIILKPKG